MLMHGLLERFSALKLHGMVRALEAIESTKPGSELSFEDRLTVMLDHEEAARSDRALTRRLHLARLRYPQACLEDVDFKRREGLCRTALLALGRCEWIRVGYNLVLTGPTGIGKSWLSCALGRRACQEGYSVRYLRLPNFFDMMQAARGDGTAPRLIERLGKVQLLILDEFGLYPMNGDQRRDLMEITEERTQRHSTIITSQLPSKQWHEIFGDRSLADAMLDRFLNAAYRLELSGPSMRSGDGPPELK